MQLRAMSNNIKFFIFEDNIHKQFKVFELLEPTPSKIELKEANSMSIGKESY